MSLNQIKWSRKGVHTIHQCVLYTSKDVISNHYSNVGSTNLINVKNYASQKDFDQL